MTEFTTTPDVLEAVVAVAQAKLQEIKPGGQGRVGAPKAKDVGRQPRLSVHINSDKGVDHEGYSRRTLLFTLVLMVRDDKSDGSLGVTELLRLCRLYEPIHFDLLVRVEKKTGPFAALPHLQIRESSEGLGVQSDGFDDTDGLARVGCTFQAIFNRRLPEVSTP
ncbi:MAG: hypothetical protein AAGE65_03475 [Planctomycetota bacterium]